MVLKKMRMFSLSLIALLVLLAPGAVIAGTIYVDVENSSADPDGSQSNPFPSIQQGISYAEFFGHQRVEVAAGVYQESLVMATGVSVIGAGADVTIISGSDRGNQPTVEFFETKNNPRLSGFTISGGAGIRIGVLAGIPIFGGGGIFVLDSAPTISDNIITGNHLTQGICRGGGIYVNAAFEGPSIIGNVISNNIALSEEDAADHMGGGIYVASKRSSAVIVENIIEFNQAELGGGIYSINITESNVSIARNTLAYNQAREGAALMTQDYENSTTTIVNNLIYGNSSTDGLIDCDDGESLASPGLSEVCNDTIDNDCNPSTPDIFDGDGDGSMCDLDCADDDVTISHLTGEHCRDGIDNDCDGSIDVASPENVVLLEEGSPMTYLANSISPGIGLDWVAVEFDDSVWDAGAYGIGYETDTDGAQDLITTEVGNDTISAYTRATFSVSGLSSVNTLWWGADYDDGYVVWLNGTEVYRSAEMASGDPAWDAYPSAHESSNGSDPDYGTLVDISSDGIPLLVEGENILAVGIYNDTNSSADLVMVPRLSMSWGTDDPDCLCDDADSDGYGISDCDTDGNGDDCDDSDPSVNPSEVEICNDGIDNDCDAGTTDVFDGDGDGYNCAVDCSDWDPNVNPGAAETVCDGIDNDCNPGTPDVVDADSDFFDCTVDCNDGSPAIKPSALEYCYDGIDNNCDGYIDDADLECSCAEPVDVDGDTYRCLDCNDGDPDINPGENELCNDGIDNDCNPNTPDIFDGDNDGHDCDVDCQDFDAAINLGAYELCNDGLDNDCDGDSDDTDSDCACDDLDSDGYATASVCGSDCDDGNASINPGMAEICDDEIDNDCDTDGTPDLYDNDSDGVNCDTDCDDDNASTYPNAAEICNDDYDNDCDDLIDVLDPERALVAFGSSMRYLENYSDPGIGVAWVAESYNDLPWSNGLYGVGYQVGPPGTGADDLITTDVPDGASSVYTRAKFTIPELDGVNEILLGADYDDGYVAWINGIEVYRSPEMPGGTPAWDADPALHESSNGLVPDYGTLVDISSDGMAALHEGENVLALGVYNDLPSGTYSSDLVVVPLLQLSYGSDDPECLCDDFDMDGYANIAVCGTDCDDGDPAVNPGAMEIGCDFTDNDCDAGTPDILDADSDGEDCDVDCLDNNPDVNTREDEIWCDFIDNDCDGLTADIVDGDSDGYICYDDCDDADETVNPGATEIACDDIDNDCNDLTPDIHDGDGDGYDCDVDCNDGDPAISPGAPEHCTDGIDNDCDGDSDGAEAECGCDDLDSDGYATAAVCGTDCNDADGAVNPGNLEICNDGIDNDCDTDGTVDLFDMDSDGFDCLADCDDDNPSVHPDAFELCNDGIDNDCDSDSLDLFDSDSDSYACDVDCNNIDPTIHPGVEEICDDGIDNDCDPATQDVFDGDSDGSNCTFDCDDDDGLRFPGAGETCGDGIDNDCNVATTDLFDGDSDGYSCDIDCDDSDAAVNPAGMEKCDDGIDNDCDGTIDFDPPGDVTLVEAGKAIRHLANSADPGVGITWVAADFDDAGWGTGSYGVGYEADTDGAQDLIATGVPVDSLSVYTRASFIINGVAAVNTLSIGADYDDGYVAWVNGTEVYRSPEMPGGDPAWNALPTTHESSNGTSPNYGTLVDISSDGIPALVEGANVLAVGIYNDVALSSDLVLVPKLSMNWGGTDSNCQCDDSDSDGYATDAVCGADCNDADPAINPEAAEVCNDTIDNDCNAATPDVGDGDSDGYLCTLDCNDGDATVNPGATELCGDGIDNDCDTDGTPDVWDLDSDGHACDVDCNETDQNINPGQMEIGCDGMDNDCDTMTTDLRDGDSDDYACADLDVRGAGISAVSGGGGFTYIVNNTVIENSLTLGRGGGIWIDDMMAGTPSLVANNIVADNSALAGGGIDHTAFFGDLRFNSVYNNVPEDFYDAGGSTAVKEGNLFIDPMMASPSSGNYRLQRSSPLIDAADPAFAPQSDLDRFYRPYDGDRDSDAIADIGAFEYPSGEVFGFVFTGTDTMSWEVLPADEGFNLYRASLAVLKSSGLYTQRPQLPIPEQFCGLLPGDVPYTDGNRPSSGNTFIYLVTTVTTAFEGSLGQASSWELRANDHSCP